MKLNINAANIITAVVYVLVISIFAAFVGYYWWVWQYAFNLVIAPIFGIKAITREQAAALLLYLFYFIFHITFLILRCSIRSL